ncbi:hypothetical protein KVR01_002499 [Diaporthe batatas]|uniref:uncharacterized protein n=1 Tax=Diaporthe batatas TaxID=748121 RepID=UPI001D0412CE|nr:uncharacterized protein KVR01_002499 [Diaporthe batatas]KAG8166810.1 hypothetical protein KVR01_002499 [Diaporthe batatas]
MGPGRLAWWEGSRVLAGSCWLAGPPHHTTIRTCPIPHRLLVLLPPPWTQDLPCIGPSFQQRQQHQQEHEHEQGTAPQINLGHKHAHTHHTPYTHGTRHTVCAGPGC